ncbi:MAG: MCE family protein [Ideonella sp.]|nr:MCE family protein [Ideonella sp.]
MRRPPPEGVSQLGSGPSLTQAATPAPPAAEVPELLEPVLSRQNRLRMSLLWVVPIVAVVVGIVLVVRAVLQTGPEIGIDFPSAEGLESGRTEVRFKEVVVGRVKRVTLSPDRQRVHVTVGLARDMAGIAVEDTRFWVVRPRIGLAGVSGLGTLVSGAYVGVDAGRAEESRTEFVGLDAPPLLLRGEPGRSFALRADDLGSLDIGSPVYHRRIRVGRVVGYTLDPQGKGLQVQVFIEAPHERLVTTRSRFWNASGVEVSLGTSGLTVNTQSVASVLTGGLAFANPEDLSPGATAAPPAVAGHAFQLFATERAALAPEDGEPLRVRMVFKQSLRGLEPGAPVDLLGVTLGTVRQIELQRDAQGRSLPLEVTADLYPMRLGKLRARMQANGTTTTQGDRLIFKQLVERGLRAQVRNGNLLTGQLYVALDFVPKAPPARLDLTATVPTLPTVPGTFSDVQPQLAEIVARLSKVRFDEIGGDLQGVLKSVNTSTATLQATLASADTMIRQLTPEAQRTLADVQKTLVGAQQTLRSVETNFVDAQAPLQRSTGQALAEVQRAAQALRVLADYLQRHPESLLRGKPADPVEGPR